MEIYRTFYFVLLKLWRVYCEKKHFYESKKMIEKRAGGKNKFPGLNKEQKRAVRRIWKAKGCFNYDTHLLVYWVTGKFAPKIVPEIYIRLNLEFDFNNQFQKYAWSDKNVLDQLIARENLPHTLIRNIDGSLYDRDYHYISKAQAVKCLKEYDQVFFKPAIDSGFGKGADILSEYNLDMFKSLGKNWVIQELIKPHEQIRKLNTTAVSIMRMFTFYIEGNVYMTSASVRVGMTGAVTDVTLGRDDGGVFIIGINKEGKMRKYGYYPNGKKMDTTPNGYKFGGISIPSYRQAVELVKKSHLCFPHCRFIGWDVTVNESGQPMIIECNLKGPGVLYYQYTNGPLFGDDFEEIYKRIG